MSISDSKSKKRRQTRTVFETGVFHVHIRCYIIIYVVLSLKTCSVCM